MRWQQPRSPKRFGWTRQRRRGEPSKPRESRNRITDSRSKRRGWRMRRTLSRKLAQRGEATYRKGLPMIKTGTLLMEKGTPIPQFFSIGTESYPNAWMQVTTTRSFAELEKDLSIAGWTFFYLAGEIRTIGIGIDKKKGIDAALRRLMANVTLQK